MHRGEGMLGRALRWSLRRVSGWPTLDSCARVGWYLRDASMGVVTRCNRGAPLGARRLGGAGSENCSLVLIPSLWVSKLFFLTSARSSALMGWQLGAGEGWGRCVLRVCVVSGTVDTPERPDEALTGPSKTGPVCCGTSTARRTHGRPCAGHRGGGHQTCSSVEAGHARRGRGARGGAHLLTRTRT